MLACVPRSDFVEALDRDFADAIDVVVGEDQQPLARTGEQVEHKAPVLPSVRVGHVAEADDRVAGPRAATGVA